MKKFLVNESKAACGEQTRAGRAFTLVELLVVLGTVAMLSAVFLSASFTTPERVLRAQCVANLRQIANGWNMYQQDFNQMMPCHWPGYASPGSTALPWRTYEAYRVYPGTGEIYTDPPNGDSPWNLGLLYATRLIPGPKVFYCPATARINAWFAYDYYITIANSWPSTPIGSDDDKIRTGYNYLPQGRKLENIGSGRTAPIVGYGTSSGISPLRQNDIDPKRSILTDLARNSEYLSHRAAGAVAGLNALFPDGRVVFQNARNNPQAFDPALWKSATDTDYLGNNAINFRYVMSLWKP
jgi:type II secretory pathway pseudopilin PulG